MIRSIFTFWSSHFEQCVILKYRNTIYYQTLVFSSKMLSGDKHDVEAAFVHHLPVEGVDVFQVDDVNLRQVIDNYVTIQQTCINTMTYLRICLKPAHIEC